MNTFLKRAAVGIAMLVMLSVTTNGQFYHVSENHPNHKIVHTNPLEGLKSEEATIRFDSAYMLGELKESKAEIPLMKTLREDADQSVRIVAALSLIKLGKPIGVNLVKRVAELTDCPKTCSVLSKFYESYNRHRDLPNRELTDFQIASMIYDKQ